MSTIDNLDISVYNLYALRTKMLEQINQEFRLDQAATIPPQTMVLDLYPRMTELDILLGVVPVCTPWAYFLPPKKLRFLRRSPFSYRVAPSIGNYEQQEETLNLLESIETHTPEEELDKKRLRRFFKQMEQINEWLSFISGRIGQFLQG